MDEFELLNRLFIVVGMLAILLIVAAFAVPAFVDWSAYRLRLEAIASEALGTDVRVHGDFDVRFLPQPRMRINEVVIGPADTPSVEIENVDVAFSLFDFLRDHYTVTKLIVRGPRVHLGVDARGDFSQILQVPEQTSATNISIEDADIIGGVLEFSDARSGAVWRAEGIAGNLQLNGLRGPYALQAGFEFDGRSYDGRVTSSALGREGQMQTSLFVRPQDGSFSVLLEGLVETVDRMHFSGATEVKIAQPQDDDQAGARGDFTFAAKVKAYSEELLLSDYVLLPDENRPATRLTGAARFDLGADPQFGAIISGGVVRFGGPAKVDEAGAMPNEVFRFLSQIPTPFMPSMRGHIGIDLAELQTENMNLRQVQLDARSTGDGWDISRLEARLPGATALTLKGQLGVKGDQPVFEGSMGLKTQRLDGFAAQWKKADALAPLLNVPAQLEGQLTLGDGLISLTDGALGIGNAASTIAVEMTQGDMPELTISAQMGPYDRRHSAMLLALLPDVGSAAEGAQAFGFVSFDIDAPRMELLGHSAQDIHLAGSWAKGQLNVERFAAKDWGGVSLDTSAGLKGDIFSPEINGLGAIEVLSAKSALLDDLANTFDVAPALMDKLGLLAPLRARFNLTPGAAAAQTLRVEGQAGALIFDGTASLAEGLGAAMTAPVEIDVVAQVDDGAQAATQFGLPVFPLVEADDLQFDLTGEGSIGNSLELALRLSSSAEELAYTGNLVVADPTRLTGTGSLRFELADMTRLATLFGVEGIGFGGVKGAADVVMGPQKLALSNIDAFIGDIALMGDLLRQTQASVATISGDLSVAEISVEQLAGLLGGSTAIAIGGDVWPVGPFTLAQSARQTKGRVNIETSIVRQGARELAQNAQFGVAWDADETRLRNFSADIGAGRVSLDVSFCCHANLLEHQAKGRISLTNVTMADLMPNGSAQIDGQVDLAAQLNATGSSFADLMQAMTGEGNFVLRDLRIAGFAPKVFDIIAEAAQAEQLDEVALEQKVRAVLADGPFMAPSLGGIFSVAGGNLRVSNVLAQTGEARLAGGLALNLEDLALNGRWTLMPLLDATGTNARAQVSAELSGSLVAPVSTYDLGPMLDELKFRAYEREVEALETAKTEQEARAAAARAERAKLREEQALKIEQERAQAEQAAKAAAARKAADAAETKRQAEADAERRALEREQALDLLLDPSDNIAPEVNQIDPNFKLPEVNINQQNLF